MHGRLVGPSQVSERVGDVPVRALRRMHALKRRNHVLDRGKRLLATSEPREQRGTRGRQHLDAGAALEPLDDERRVQRTLELVRVGQQLTAEGREVDPVAP